MGLSEELGTYENQKKISILPKVGQRGRPPLPPSQRKIPISTTLYPHQIAKIETMNWVINELIADGIRHRESCETTILQQKETIEYLTSDVTTMQINISKLQRKLVEFEQKTTGGD